MGGGGGDSGDATFISLIYLLLLNISVVIIASRTSKECKTYFVPSGGDNLNFNSNNGDLIRGQNLVSDYLAKHTLTHDCGMKVINQQGLCSANKTDNLSVQSSNLLSANANSTESPKLRQSIRCFNSVSRDKVSSRIEKLSSDNKRMISWINLLLSKTKESGALHVSSMTEDSGGEEERFEVTRVESDPGGERERGGGRAVAEGGEFEVVAAAGGGEDGELVLEDERAAGDDVVDGEEALEGDGGVAGAVEAVHEGGDEGGGGGA
nr:hypothetical protein Iba_chr11dCG0890 [Ipomoea batatas]